MQRLRVKRSDGTAKKLLSAILTRLPGAWIDPSASDLVSLYRIRFRMALDEKKYDTALIFLNKILEVDPLNREAKLSKAEIYHHHLGDYGRAVEQYSRILKLSAGREPDPICTRARASLTELMELMS